MNASWNGRQLRFSTTSTSIEVYLIAPAPPQRVLAVDPLEPHRPVREPERLERI